eukprot:TRINITY_DN7354_c0_g1_i1.p1 TRINITY_DN7354_c0_g1~~TRINITY_DN7354_c0_g1_i1.p1  ORF type:complete len:351 (+),score=32.32 TRINITY_DN7354_c0_g1_i1:24-1076(+)
MSHWPLLQDNNRHSINYSSRSVMTRVKRLASRDGALNYERSGVSWWKLYVSDSYHYVLNLKFWKLLTVAFVYYLAVNLLFGCLYYADIGNISNANHFYDAFYLSVETMSTIGFGKLNPDSFYLRSIVFFQTWMSLMFDGVVVALVFSKVSRPSKLRHTIKFSKVAVINKTKKAFQYYDPDWPYTGEYEYKQTINFRLVNMRKRQICESEVFLLLLRKEEYGINSQRYVLHELSFELNRQKGRTRFMDFSTPLLPLPWEIYHTLDENSPLYDLIQDNEFVDDFEIIVVFSGIDELTSCNFQSRFSYLPQEIIWNREFVDIVSRDDESGRIAINFHELSTTTTEYDLEGMNM